MTLVNQPTAAPTRKMTAVIIAGIATAAAQTMLARYAPDFAGTQFLEDFNIWVQALVMIGFGYMTKEREV